MSECSEGGRVSECSEGGRVSECSERVSECSEGGRVSECSEGGRVSVQISPLPVHHIECDVFLWLEQLQ